MSKAHDIVEAALKDLEGRKGFDGWWDDIDKEIQEEIKGDLIAVVQREIDANKEQDELPNKDTVDIPTGDPASTDDADDSGFGIVPDGETVEGNLEAEAEAEDDQE